MYRGKARCSAGLTVQVRCHLRRLSNASESPQKQAVIRQLRPPKRLESVLTPRSKRVPRRLRSAGLWSRTPPEQSCSLFPTHLYTPLRVCTVISDCQQLFKQKGLRLTIQEAMRSALDDLLLRLVDLGIRADIWRSVRYHSTLDLEQLTVLHLVVRSGKTCVFQTEQPARVPALNGQVSSALCSTSTSQPFACHELRSGRLVIMTTHKVAVDCLRSSNSSDRVR